MDETHEGLIWKLTYSYDYWIELYFKREIKLTLRMDGFHKPVEK
jgi:hypothetical protein